MTKKSKRFEATTTKLVMAKQEMAVEHVTPHSLEVLSGNLGLVDDDIGRSIGVPATQVRKKLNRGEFIEFAKSVGFKIIPFETFNENNVRVQHYAFDLNAAKAFVAKWDNKLGWEYLAFLLRCEQVATEGVPVLLARIEELEKRLSKHERPRLVRSDDGERRYLITEVVPERDIFGNTELVKTRHYQPANELCRDEIVLAELSQLTAIVGGIAKKQDALQRELLFMKLPPSQRQGFPKRGN